MNGILLWISVLRRIYDAFGPFSGTWDDFFELFKKGPIVYEDWFDFVVEYWKHRTCSNIHVVVYEDAKDSHEKTVRNITTFLGIELSNERISKVVELTSFEAMKSRLHGNKIMFGGVDPFLKPEFLYQGQYGKWQGKLTDEQINFLDERYAEKILHHQLPIRYK